MVQYIGEAFGRNIGQLNGVSLYSFPALEDFASYSNDELEKMFRENGFGYRARYIAATIDQLFRKFQGSHKAMMHWFNNELASEPYEKILEELTVFQGIGRKVADCVALFGLGQFQVVPMDTHMLSIATRFYGVSLAGKNGSAKRKKNGSKTAAISEYDKACQVFLDRFAPMPGWAHLFLYVSDLKQLSQAQ